MQQYFDKILKSETGHDFLVSIPYRYIQRLLSSNSLNVTDEHILMDLFEKYLKHRDESALPKLAEEDPEKLFFNLLSDEEKKAREDKKAEEETKKAEEAKAAKDAYEAEKSAQPEWMQYNYTWREKVTETKKECDTRAAISRLTKEQK